MHEWCSELHPFLSPASPCWLQSPPPGLRLGKISLWRKCGICLPDTKTTMSGMCRWIPLPKDTEVKEHHGTLKRAPDWGNQSPFSKEKPKYNSGAELKLFLGSLENFSLIPSKINVREQRTDMLLGQISLKEGQYSWSSQVISRWASTFSCHLEKSRYASCHL